MIKIRPAVLALVKFDVGLLPLLKTACVSIFFYNNFNPTTPKPEPISIMTVGRSARFPSHSDDSVLPRQLHRLFVYNLLRIMVSTLNELLLEHELPLAPGHLNNDRLS